jgi:hypothetical protein
MSSIPSSLNIDSLGFKVYLDHNLSKASMISNPR